jgi:MoaA/NifB/PqqE/SkfB family radical SAM enzyme
MTGALPEVLDLRLLGACNLRCPFCFGPRHELAPRSTGAFVQLVAELPRYGVRGVVITGGEPTLVRDLPTLLGVAKAAGLKTVLSTNGARLGARLDDLAPYLDWVALPLDGDRPERHARMRIGGRDHFGTVLHLMGRIRAEHPHLRIKLGTVVCAINRDWIARVPDVVAGRRAPDVWKLYQVERAGYAASHWDRLALGDADFDAVLERATGAAARHGIPVTSYRRSERTGKYLFVEPNGDAMAVSGSRELVIGNFFTGLGAVLEEWRDHVFPQRLAANVASTYPGV